MKTSIELWSPLTPADLSWPDARNLEIAFKALGDQVRLQMLSSLLFDTPLCVTDFQEQLGISQSLASHHLGKLVDAGILQRSPAGRRTMYWITEGALETLSAALVGGTLDSQPKTPALKTAK